MSLQLLSNDFKYKKYFWKKGKKIKDLLLFGCLTMAKIMLYLVGLREEGHVEAQSLNTPFFSLFAFSLFSIQQP